MAKAVLITCHICVRLGKKPFETLYDTQGTALMHEHLKDHRERGEMKDITLVGLMAESSKQLATIEATQNG